MADGSRPPAELHERLLICRTIKLNAGAHGGHRRCCHAQMQKNAQNKPQIARLILCVHTTLQVYCNLFLTFCFVDNKAVKRQYHTFFNWDGKNANQFFGLFGDTFKRRAREEIQTKSLDDAEVAFMSIGQERNRLVHQNYIEAQINDTFEEIYIKYEKACDFVELITQLLSV